MSMTLSSVTALRDRLREPIDKLAAAKAELREAEKSASAARTDLARVRQAETGAHAHAELKALEALRDCEDAVLAAARRVDSAQAELDAAARRLRDESAPQLNRDLARAMKDAASKTDAASEAHLQVQRVLTEMAEAGVTPERRARPLDVLLLEMNDPIRGGGVQSPYAVWRRDLIRDGWTK